MGDVSFEVSIPLDSDGFIEMECDYCKNRFMLHYQVYESEDNINFFCPICGLPNRTNGFQLIKYILDGPKQLIGICMGYTSSNKFSDNIEAFMRKSIEPFVVAVRTYIELNFIDADDENANLDKTVKTVFLSYCQKDKDIADCIDEKIGHILEGKATLSRDIRDVEYHESFKKFMQSIENHDYVISIISDNYLKSRNCMYEMLEVVKDSKFSQRLLFIVLTNEDAKYYTPITWIPFRNCFITMHF
ncbi:uncharacterized protein BN671_02337 [Roseburia sp. CAG:471]|nr:uncharacterized protein BN671_02337 [Roseburia sp. CAG:471]